MSRRVARHGNRDSSAIAACRLRSIGRLEPTLFAWVLELVQTTAILTSRTMALYSSKLYANGWLAPMLMRTSALPKGFDRAGRILANRGSPSRANVERGTDNWAEQLIALAQKCHEGSCRLHVAPTQHLAFSAATLTQGVSTR